MPRGCLCILIGAVCASMPQGWCLEGDVHDWTIRVRLLAGHGQDQSNYFGVDLGSLPCLDDRDVMEPPLLPGRLNLAFICPNESIPRLAKDMRNPIVSSETWTFETVGLRPGSTHYILFSNLNEVPSEYRILLTDTERGITTDLRTSPQYVFIPQSEETRRVFHIDVINDPPPKPEGLSVSILGDTVFLSWLPVDVEDLAIYVVYGGNDPFYPTEVWIGDERPSLSISGLSSPEKTWFRVSAVDRSENQGEASEAVCACSEPAPPGCPYDLDSNERMDRRDVFLLSNVWKRDGASKASGEPIGDVDPNYLYGFLRTWRDERVPPSLPQGGIGDDGAGSTPFALLNNLRNEGYLGE